MTKYQIDGAESAAVELRVYVPFRLCILIFGGFFFGGRFIVFGFCVAGFSHTTGYFYEKKLDKISFHKIKLN